MCFLNSQDVGVAISAIFLAQFPESLLFFSLLFFHNNLISRLRSCTVRGEKQEASKHYVYASVLNTVEENSGAVAVS